MEITDTHSHTWYSGHGEGTPAELVAVARSKGLTTLAITEHLTLPPAIDPHRGYSLQPDQVVNYLQEVTTAAAEAANDNPQIEVILGCEVDWRHQAADFILQELDRAASQYHTPYQLVLGSVHMLTGEDGFSPDDFWPLDMQSTIDGWHQRGLRYVWEKYVSLWLEAAASPVPITVMTHPDLPKRLGFYPDFDALPLWRQMAEAARAHNRMIEVNTAGLFYPCAEVFPGPALLAEFQQAGVPCMVSADAHTPGNVGRAHQIAVEAMWQAGYRTVSVPTRDGDRRQIPIE